jgi:Ca2+-binding EF-hand superfamily protein
LDKLHGDIREVVEELREMISRRRPGDDDYRTFFDRFDYDHSGVIEGDELKRGLKKIGFRLTTRQTDEIMNQYGTSGGRLKYYQFVRLLEPSDDAINQLLRTMRDVMRDDGIDMRSEFRRMDRDDRGYLSRRDFSRGLQDIGIFNLTDSDVRRVMDRFDKDGDGKIDYREFRKTLEDAANVRASSSSNSRSSR